MRRLILCLVLLAGVSEILDAQRLVFRRRGSSQAGPGETTLDCSGNTCYYIRDGGSASTTGTGACNSTGSGSWNTANACDDLPATLVRGAYYVVADGTYASKTFSTAASGSTPIYIFKATETNHGTSTGWLSSYGDGQADFASTLTFSTNWWVFNGQYRDETDWFDGTSYGFKIRNNSNAAEQQAIVTGDNVTLKYLWAEGRSGSYSGAERRYALDTEGGGTTDDPTFSHMLVTDSNNVWFLRNSDGAVVEYSASTGATGDEFNHGEVVNLYFTAENSIIRFNQITNAYKAGGGTALIAIADDRGTSTPPTSEIYGNLAWDFGTSDAAIGFLGNPSNGGNCTNCKVLNNTLVDGQFGFANSWAVQFPDGSGNVVQNNLWIRNGGSAPNGFDLGASSTFTHNGYGTSSTTFGTSAQGSIPTSIFVTFASYANLRLASGTTAGATLSAPYNVDMFGCTRGGDGTWDRGAFEYPAC